MALTPASAPTPPFSSSSVTQRGTGWVSDDKPVRFQAGDRLADKYVLLHPLGEGGWGTVWLARNEALDAMVAVKVIPRRERHE